MIDFPLDVFKARIIFKDIGTPERLAIFDLFDKAEARGSYIRVRLDLPSRQKTSPENRLFHALVGQLCMYSGLRYEKQWSFDITKRYIKIRACAHDYPCDIVDDGQGRKIVEPKSVADASTVEVAILIETCFMVAADWGVELKQEGI